MLFTEFLSSAMVDLCFAHYGQTPPPLLQEEKSRAPLTSHPPWTSVPLCSQLQS